VTAVGISSPDELHSWHAQEIRVDGAGFHGRWLTHDAALALGLPAPLRKLLVA
jgi:hypothetical protein